MEHNIILMMIQPKLVGSVFPADPMVMVRMTVSSLVASLVFTMISEW